MSRTAPLTIALIFGRACDQMGQKGQYLAKNASFGPNLAVFGPKIYFLGEGVNLLVPSYQGPMRHLFRVENIDRCGSNFPLGTKMCNFNPKIWIFGAKSQFFVLQSRFLSTGHITSTIGATAFPLGPPRKNFRFRAMGHFPGLTPVFGHFGLLSLQKYKYRLDRCQRNLVGPSGQ